MTRPVLLLTLGADALPNTTPVVPVSATWVPVVYVPPPVAAPANLVLVAVADAVTMSWLRSTMRDAVTVIETAPDVAGAPGAWAEKARTADANYTLALSGGVARWVRLKAVAFGKSSAYTAAQLATPTTVGTAASVTAAQAAADAANSNLVNIASDALLTPDEKPRVIQDRDVIMAEQAGIDAQATAYAITTEKTAYDDAVAALTAYLATLTDPVLWSNLSGNTTIVGAPFRQKFADVYAARQALVNKIVERARSIAEEAQSSGTNICPNPSFELNFSGVQLGIDRSGTGVAVTDDWEVGEDANIKVGIHAVAGRRGSGQRAMLVGTKIGGAIRGPGLMAFGGAFSRRRFPCDGGDRFRVSCFMFRDTSGPPAGVNCTQLLNLRFYNKDGGYLSQSGAVVGNTVGGSFTVRVQNVVTAPTGAASYYIFPQIVVDNATGGNVTADDGWCSGWFDDIIVSKMVNLDSDIDDGINYGRFGLADGVFYNGVRRNGLRIPGSGQRTGDQRNLPQSNTTAYGSVRSATALTATSTGAVSINAHSVRYGGISVAYNAVSNAVTGLAVGSTYVIYCFDDAYAGGTRTWYAGTNPNTVMQLGDGVVVAGQITIPSAGSSGGGGGGDGVPEDWCVDWDCVLPDGRLVRDLVPGDLVPCWGGTADAPRVEMVPLRAIAFGEEASYTLVGDDGRITQSKSTPMDTRDGRVVRTDAMLGEDVLTFDGLRWEPVREVIPVGVRRVVKPDLGNRMLFAGDSIDRCIATHNALMKP